MKIKLSDDSMAIIDREMQTGGYADEQEFVEVAIRAYERHLTYLREKLDKGAAEAARGEGTVVRTPEELSAFFASIGGKSSD